jgi:phosphatidylserine/phosphatidylglycerophosphate/cardiolipin synthase-like enzyme
LLKKELHFIKVLVILFTFSLPLLALNKESFFLLPKEKDYALSEIIRHIDLAQKNINIAIYSFTNKTIAKKLKNAAARGVNIEIIFDDKSTRKKGNRSKLHYLAKYKNIKTYRLKGKLSKNRKYSGIMHMKVAIIDNKYTISGSANWSNSAFSINYEVLSIRKNYAIAKKFNKYFQELKKRATLFK